MYTQAQKPYTYDHMPQFEEMYEREMQERNAALNRDLTTLPWMPSEDLEGVTADDIGLDIWS